MRYRLTINYGSSRVSLDAIGDRDRLMDAAYKDGALGVSIVAKQ